LGKEDRSNIFTSCSDALPKNMPGRSRDLYYKAKGGMEGEKKRINRAATERAIRGGG